jgi:hypothetical protein
MALTKEEKIKLGGDLTVGTFLLYGAWYLYSHNFNFMISVLVLILGFHHFIFSLFDVLIEYKYRLIAKTLFSILFSVILFKLITTK